MVEDKRVISRAVANYNRSVSMSIEKNKNRFLLRWISITTILLVCFVPLLSKPATVDYMQTGKMLLVK